MMVNHKLSCQRGAAVHHYRPRLPTGWAVETQGGAGWLSRGLTPSHCETPAPPTNMANILEAPL
jgi:hypothetical protein